MDSYNLDDSMCVNETDGIRMLQTLTISEWNSAYRNGIYVEGVTRNSAFGTAASVSSIKGFGVVPKKGKCCSITRGFGSYEPGDYAAITISCNAKKEDYPSIDGIRCTGDIVASHGVVRGYADNAEAALVEDSDEVAVYSGMNNDYNHTNSTLRERLNTDGSTKLKPVLLILYTGFNNNKKRGGYGRRIYVLGPVVFTRSMCDSNGKYKFFVKRAK